MKLSEIEKMTTIDLAKFGTRELAIAAQILEVYTNGGCPEEFEQTGVNIMMNIDSGFVFLVNDSYQAAVMNGNKLEMFYYCSNCGKDGFANEGFCGKDKSICDECAIKNEIQLGEANE
jgi:hypothetical protein